MVACMVVHAARMQHASTMPTHADAPWVPTLCTGARCGACQAAGVPMQHPLLLAARRSTPQCCGLRDAASMSVMSECTIVTTAFTNMHGLESRAYYTCALPVAGTVPRSWPCSRCSHGWTPDATRTSHRSYGRCKPQAAGAHSPRLQRTGKYCSRWLRMGRHAGAARLADGARRRGLMWVAPLVGLQLPPCVGPQVAGRWNRALQLLNVPFPAHARLLMGEHYHDRTRVPLLRAAACQVSNNHYSGL